MEVNAAMVLLKSGLLFSELEVWVGALIDSRSLTQTYRETILVSVSPPMTAELLVGALRKMSTILDSGYSFSRNESRRCFTLGPPGCTKAGKLLYEFRGFDLDLLPGSSVRPFAPLDSGQEFLEIPHFAVDGPSISEIRRIGSSGVLPEVAESDEPLVDSFLAAERARLAGARYRNAVSKVASHFGSARLRSSGPEILSHTYRFAALRCESDSVEAEPGREQSPSLTVECLAAIMICMKPGSTMRVLCPVISPARPRKRFLGNAHCYALVEISRDSEPLEWQRALRLCRSLWLTALAHAVDVLPVADEIFCRTGVLCVSPYVLFDPDLVLDVVEGISPADSPQAASEVRIASPVPHLRASRDGSRNTNCVRFRLTLPAGNQRGAQSLLDELSYRWRTGSVSGGLGSWQTGARVPTVKWRRSEAVIRRAQEADDWAPAGRSVLGRSLKPELGLWEMISTAP